MNNVTYSSNQTENREINKNQSNQPPQKTPLKGNEKEGQKQHLKATY